MTDTDQPSAVRELADDPASRKRFLKMVGGAGAAGAFSIFLAACGGDDEDATAESGSTTKESMAGSSGDMAIVEYALTLEYLETDFYNKVVEADILDGELLETAKVLGGQEQEHVDALEATLEKLGGDAAGIKPRTTFPLENRDSVIELAATVENLGAAAYLGQAGNIRDKEILAAALAIHSVEGRHAAALNRVVGKTIVPDGAFAKPASMDEVLEKVKPFIQT
jgi:rubrerythrin